MHIFRFFDGGLMVADGGLLVVNGGLLVVDGGLMVVDGDFSCFAGHNRPEARSRPMDRGVCMFYAQTADDNDTRNKYQIFKELIISYLQLDFGWKKDIIVVYLL